jgi:hypothetical protein
MSKASYVTQFVASNELAVLDHVTCRKASRTKGDRRCGRKVNLTPAAREIELASSCHRYAPRAGPQARSRPSAGSSSPAYTLLIVPQLRPTDGLGSS